MSKFAVYCGSQTGADEKYMECAKQVGEILVACGYGLVYGGGQRGLMGRVADTVMDGGGEVIGVIPTFLDERELANKRLKNLHVVEDMHVRKRMMMEEADAGFIVLPGGPGTMEEFYEVLAWKQLELHDKPIIVVNVDGYYDSIQGLLQGMYINGFMNEESLNLCTFVTSAEELEKLISK